MGGGVGGLTPANEDEHPLAQPVGGVCEHDGRVQVAALPKHPEEVGHMEVVVGGCHQPAPALPPAPTRYDSERGGLGGVGGDRWGQHLHPTLGLGPPLGRMGHFCSVGPKAWLWPCPSPSRTAPPDPSSEPGPAPPGHTMLLWWTSGLMVSWTTNHVALRRMKAEMRFQWMMFLRQRMLLGAAGEVGVGSKGRGERRRDRPQAPLQPRYMGGETEPQSGADRLSHTWPFLPVTRPDLSSGGRICHSQCSRTRGCPSPMGTPPLPVVPGSRVRKHTGL